MQREKLKKLTLEWMTPLQVALHYINKKLAYIKKKDNSMLAKKLEETKIYLENLSNTIVN